MALHKHKGTIGLPVLRPSTPGRGQARGISRRPKVVLGRRTTLKKKIV